MATPRVNSNTHNYGYLPESQFKDALKRADEFIAELERRAANGDDKARRTLPSARGRRNFRIRQQRSASPSAPIGGPVRRFTR